MRYKVLGSGGMQQIPRACCNCNVCTEARIKGFPYKRKTQSLYLYDIHAIFDTPECISEELNTFDINCVSYVFYTHFHPDHTMGCRIIEELREDKTEKYQPIIVNHPKSGIDISFNQYTPILNLFEQAGYCSLNSETITKVNDISIIQIPLDNKFACGYLIQQNNKKLFYCPCHAMYISKNIDALKNIDIMLLGIGYINYIDDVSTNFKRNIIPLIEHYQPKQTIFTHLEESDGISYDEHCSMEKQYSYLNIMFSYDGMEIEI